MDLKGLFKGCFGRQPRPRLRRTPFGRPALAIESLEQRVVPVSITITSMPTHTAHDLAEVTSETNTDPDDGTAGWSQHAVIQWPEDGGFGHGTGQYTSTGDLVFKVNADEEDLIGCPVKITLTFSGRVFWSDDPGGPTNTSTFKNYAGIATPSDVIDLEGGHIQGELKYGVAYTFSETGYTRVIETFIGESITVKIQQEGYGEPWRGFHPFPPPNTIATITTGVIDAKLDVYVSDIESLQREIDVGTSKDDLESEDLFGPYLENVALPIKFDSYLTSELDEEDQEYKITSATWQIGGFSGQMVVKDGDLDPLVFDPKSLAPGNHKLKIAAFDSEHRPVAVTRKELRVNVIDDLTLQLHVKGKDDKLIDVDDARFFQGITAEVTFVGTIADLPSYYGGFDSTEPKISILLNNVKIGETFRVSDDGDPKYQFEFTYDVSTLPLDKSTLDLKIGNVPISTFGPQPEKLLSVAKPTWLEQGIPVFNPLTVEYQWIQAHLGFLKLEAPQAPPTGEKWLDASFAKTKKSKSSATLDAFLNVKASFSLKEDPKYEGSKLIGNAVLFGKTIWNKVYTSGDVAVVGTLDPKTLDPQSFGIKLAQPIEVAQFQLTQAQSIKINLLKTRLPEWLASLTLSGSVSATIGTVRVTGGVMLAKSGNDVVFVKEGTFVGFENSTIKGTGEVSLNLKVGKGYILEAGAQADITPEIRIDLIAQFSGKLGSLPTIASVNFVVSAKLKYHASAFARSKLTGQEVTWDSGDNGSADDFLGPYNIINYHVS